MMDISATTRLCATLAYPNRKTSAPAMHNAGFDALGLDLRYMAFEPRDIGEAMRAIRSLDLVGVSVSKPYKQAVIEFLDELDPTAMAIGAVNCVHNLDGHLKGYNSDWIGAVEALSEKCEVRGARVAVLGSGGAARAVVFGLVDRGADVHVFARSAERGRSLAKDMGATFGGALEDAASVAPIALVNATPVGTTQGEDVPVPDVIFNSGTTVMDIIVRSTPSSLLERAARHGAQTIGGVRMLVLQGAFTFELFTGHPAPVDVMQAAVERALTSH